MRRRWPGCPANGSSMPGVKMRSRWLAPAAAPAAMGGSTNAVSDRFISRASACISASVRPSASTKTASGLPHSGRVREHIHLAEPEPSRHAAECTASYDRPDHAAAFRSGRRGWRRRDARGPASIGTSPSATACSRRSPSPGAFAGDASVERLDARRPPCHELGSSTLTSTSATRVSRPRRTSPAAPWRRSWAASRPSWTCPTPTRRPTRSSGRPTSSRVPGRPGAMSACSASWSTARSTSWRPMAEAGLVVGFKAFLGPTTGDLPAPSDSDPASSDGHHPRHWACASRSMPRTRRSWRGRPHACGRPAGPIALVHPRAGRSRPRSWPSSASERSPLETGCAVHIVHLSSATGWRPSSDGARGGADMTCEVSANHLFLGAEDMDAIGPRMKMNPPVRLAGGRSRRGPARGPGGRAGGHGRLRPRAAHGGREARRRHLGGACGRGGCRDERAGAADPRGVYRSPDPGALRGGRPPRHRRVSGGCAARAAWRSAPMPT